VTDTNIRNYPEIFHSWPAQCLRTSSTSTNISHAKIFQELISYQPYHDYPTSNVPLPLIPRALLLPKNNSIRIPLQSSVYTAELTVTYLDLKYTITLNFRNSHVLLFNHLWFSTGNSKHYQTVKFKRQVTPLILFIRDLFSILFTFTTAKVISFGSRGMQAFLEMKSQMN